ADELDPQQLLPLGEPEFHHRRDVLNAGVAEKNIKRAERLDSPGGASLHLLFVGDIHRHADGALSAGIDLTSRFISRLLIEICNRDLRTLAGKNNGDVLADPTGCAGDNGYLVLETHANLRCPLPDLS